MRYMTSDGVFVVKFEKDTCVSIGLKTGEESHLRLRNILNTKTKGKISKEELEATTPHSVLIFKDEKSIDIMIESLIRCRKNLTGFRIEDIV